MVARLKLKGTDRRAPPGVEPAASFDSARGNFLGPDIVSIDTVLAFSCFYGLRCMALLNWWSDICG